MKKLAALIGGGYQIIALLLLDRLVQRGFYRDADRVNYWKLEFSIFGVLLILIYITMRFYQKKTLRQSTTFLLFMILGLLSVIFIFVIGRNFFYSNFTLPF